MDTGMEATSAPPHSGPNESAASTPPEAAAAAPRATIMSFFSGTSALTGTGSTTSPTAAVSQAPTTGTDTGEAPAALAATPNAPTKGPDTTVVTSSETMLLGESHEWQDDDGEALFSEPPKKKGKRTYGKQELKPLDFTTPEFGGGPNRKRYPVEYKLKATG